MGGNLTFFTLHDHTIVPMKKVLENGIARHTLVSAWKFVCSHKRNSSQNKIHLTFKSVH
jgi:hypothetical protein